VKLAGEIEVAKPGPAVRSGRSGSATRIALLLRRLLPAYRVRVEREGEFLVRLVGACLIVAATGAVFSFAPDRVWLFWLEAASLGLGISLAATLAPARPGAIGALTLGLLFGLLLAALSSTGHALLGLAAFGGGMGWIAARGKAGAYSTMNVVLVSMSGALVGAYASAALAPTFYAALPYPLAAALAWAAFALFISIGAIPMHLALHPEPILKYVKQIRRKLKKPRRAELDALIDDYLALKSRAWLLTRDDFDDYLFTKSRMEEALLISADTAITRQQIERTAGL